MRIRRKLPIFGGVVLIIIAVALAVVLRKHAPPEPARLLPGADGFFYLDLKWIRRADMTGQLPSVSHDPEYEQFIQQTGFQFERDLDQVAVAMHYPDSLPDNGTAPQETRYSEIFVGKFDGAKLRAYLQHLASSIDDYQSTNIYNIPLQGRTLRVALLNVDTVAASNHPDPLVIRGMIDRSRKLASPFGGPALLRQYYKQVPLASLAWAIFKVQPSGSNSPDASEFSFLFEKPAVIVASARYLGSVHVRAEAFTGSNADAKAVNEKVNTFLTLFRSAELSVPEQGSDADVKKFLNSLAVSQHDRRTILTAIVPPGFVRKVFAEPPQETLPSLPAQPEQKPQPRKPASQKGLRE
jgi:hypothetical protein